MVVDPRHDHSFRIPRPDLSIRLGTPNACNDCHTDKSAAWAASAIDRWYGPHRKGFQTYAEAFHAAWSNQSDAAALLATVATDPNAPAFARAGALTELAPRASPAMIDLAQKASTDPDPMVRIGALDMLAAAPGNRLWTLASPLLSDPVRSVRIQAVSLLATVPQASLSVQDRARFEKAAAEFIAAQRLNADRPEARGALGSFLASRGDTVGAEIEFQAALRLSPHYTTAAVNLADLYRGLGQDANGERVLRDAAAIEPADGGIHHALGLTLVRLKRVDDALVELHKAVELEPDRARYAYVYAVALHAVGRPDDAMAVLKQSLARHPDDHDTLLALINFSRDAGDIAAALDYAERLMRLMPGNQDLANLVQQLRQQATTPSLP